MSVLLCVGERKCMRECVYVCECRRLESMCVCECVEEGACICMW